MRFSHLDMQWREIRCRPTLTDGLCPGHCASCQLRVQQAETYGKPKVSLGVLKASSVPTAWLDWQAYRLCGAVCVSRCKQTTLLQYRLIAATASSSRERQLLNLDIESTAFLTPHLNHLSSPLYYFVVCYWNNGPVVFGWHVIFIGAKQPAPTPGIWDHFGIRSLHIKMQMDGLSSLQWGCRGPDSRSIHRKQSESEMPSCCHMLAAASGSHAPVQWRTRVCFSIFLAGGSVCCVHLHDLSMICISTVNKSK